MGTRPSRLDGNLAAVAGTITTGTGAGRRRGQPVGNANVGARSDASTACSLNCPVCRELLHACRRAPAPFTSLRTTHKVAVIVPGDSGLDSVQAEKEMLHGLARAGRTVADIPPQYVDVRNALASAEYDGIHSPGTASSRTGQTRRRPRLSSRAARSCDRATSRAWRRTSGADGRSCSSTHARSAGRRRGLPGSAAGRARWCTTAPRRSWGRTGR